MRRNEEDAIDAQRRRTGSDLLSAGSALAFGFLGWVVAHEASTWLFDHAHIPGSSPSAWHLESNAGTAALLFGCLVTGSLLALLAAPASTRAPAASRLPMTGRLPLILSIAGFVATDFAERAVAGQHGFPSFLVLVIGASVYTLIGTASSLLWHCLLGLALRALTPNEDAPHRPAAARPVRGSRLRGYPMWHWAPGVAGRAPPTPALL